MLPTNHHLHRCDPSCCGCPICNHRDKDFIHILSCAHPSRAAWRNSMLGILSATCADQWNTRPRLRDILLCGLRGWFDSPDPDGYQLDSSVYDEEFQQRLIIQQNKIGWKHIFVGRFSWEWSEMQDAFYTTRPIYDPKKCQKGSYWQVAIISCLWDQWYLLWECRNKDLHGADERQSALAERRNALRTLRGFYDLRNHYEPSVQELLMDDIRDNEARSTWDLKAWLTINEPVLRASYQRVKKLTISGMRRSLRSYWPAGP